MDAPWNTLPRHESPDKFCWHELLLEIEIHKFMEERAPGPLRKLKARSDCTKELPSL